MSPCVSCTPMPYLAQLRCGILPVHIETGRWQAPEK